MFPLSGNCPENKRFNVNQWRRVPCRDICLSGVEAGGFLLLPIRQFFLWKKALGTAKLCFFSFCAFYGRCSLVGLRLFMKYYARVFSYTPVAPFRSLANPAALHDWKLCSPLMTSHPVLGSRDALAGFLVRSRLVLFFFFHV